MCGYSGNICPREHRAEVTLVAIPHPELYFSVCVYIQTSAVPVIKQHSMKTYWESRFLTPELDKCGCCILLSGGSVLATEHQIFAIQKAGRAPESV
jgi:hypothetical protein